MRQASRVVLRGFFASMLIVACSSEEGSEEAASGGSPSTSSGGSGPGTGGAGTGGVNATGGIGSSSGGAATGGLNGSGGAGPGAGGLATGGVGPGVGGRATGGSSATGGRATGGRGPGAGGFATGGSAVGGRGPAVGGAATGGVSPNGGAPATGGGSATGGAPGIGSSGCGKPAPAEPPGAVDAEGTNRTFLVDVPDGYDPDTPAPILFAFHGMGIDASFFRNWANLLSTFGSSYVVVHPDALGDPTQWDSTGTKDIAFFDAMLELVSSTYCLDPSRVFVTGHSSGGYFTNALGCQRGDVIRGIAPQSGAGPIGARSCKGPLASLILHGSRDPSVLPIEGEKSRDYWGEAAHCDLSSGAPSILNPICVDYSGCDDGYPLVYCSYDGDHNLWNAAPQVMFDFFESL